MTNQEKQKIREEIVIAFTNASGLTLQDATEILAYVIMDVGLSAIGTTCETVEEIQAIVNEQEHTPTLAGALITQGALMIGWNQDILNLSETVGDTN